MALLAAVLLLGGSGCNPVFAPPARSVHGGAPGLPAGAWKVSGNANMYGSGGPSVSVPLGDLPLHAEVGGDFRLVGHDDEQWALGNAGLRYTVTSRGGTPAAHPPGTRPAGTRPAIADPASPEFVSSLEPKPEEDAYDPGVGGSIDLEAGGALGVGGVDSREDPRTPWDERLAGGGYVGFGAGYHVASWFAMFTRVRAQVTSAESVPTTFWGSGVAGIEFGGCPGALHTAAGFGGFDNGADGIAGLVAEGGLSIYLDSKACD